MQVVPPALERLIQDLSRLPGIGKKTASRLALHIMRSPAGAYQGHYHILHGVLAPMDGIGPEEIKINELVNRIRRQKIAEVLIATSSTVPGEATASYLSRILHAEQVKVTRLACGIPMGMDIKYADEVTLARAIETRQESK